MKIVVHAKPNSKITQVEHLSQNEYIVSVNELPVQGRANSAIIKVLAQYFDCPASNIEMIRGFSSKIKIFEISSNNFTENNDQPKNLDSKTPR